MNISPEGKNFIKKWEGCSLTPYDDVASLKTIGIGHLIKNGEHFTKLTEQECLALLDADLVPVESFLSNYKLTQNQYDALCSFAFNLGVGKLSNSSLLRYVINGEMDKAANEFPKWCHAGGRVIGGLMRRREAERRLFMDGTYE